MLSYAHDEIKSTLRQIIPLKLTENRLVTIHKKLHYPKVNFALDLSNKQSGHYEGPFIQAINSLWIW